MRERLREAALRRLMPEEREVRDRTPAPQTPEVEELQDRTLQAEIHPEVLQRMSPAGVAVGVGEVQPVPVVLPVHTVPAAGAPTSVQLQTGLLREGHSRIADDRAAIAGDVSRGGVFHQL
jgi:hypothetical protein